MTNFQSNSNNLIIKPKDNYDLEERTAKFAENVIALVKTIKITPVNTRIISQLVGAAGSIGANYCEATEAESRKDFVHKIGICKKEIKETRHWLRLLAAVNPEKEKEIKVLWKEVQELLLIFSKISRSAIKGIEN
ncbi:MAG: four helix bundle protein [Spirochaetia bacterium]|nr:MAG: four helix bundle protein [Spirochaetia bacterium]